MENPTPAAQTAIQTATPPATAPAAADPAAATATPSAAAAPAAAQAPAADEPQNLFATLKAPAAAAPAADPAAPAQPAAEPQADPTEILAAIQPSDLGTLPSGEPIPWDGEAVKAVAAVFAKHKLAPGAAAEVVAAYAAHAKAQYSAAFAAEQKAEADLNRSMIAAAKEKFGPDLPRYIADASVGGSDIFGPELWSELAKINAFSNDHRIIAALAARGRATKPDTVPAAGRTQTDDDRPLATRLYGHLK